MTSTDRVKQPSFFRPFGSGYLSTVLAGYHRRLTAQVLVAIMVVAMEGIGLGVVLLLLGAGKNSPGIPGLPWLGNLLAMVQELSIPARIQAAAIALFLITILRSGLQYLQNLQALRLKRSVERKLQLQVLQALHRLPLSILQQKPSGELQVLVNAHCRQIGQLTLAFSQAIANSVILIAYAGLAFFLSWPLTLIAAGLLIPIALIIRPLLGRHLRRAGLQTREFNKKMFRIVQEHLAAMPLIQLFARRDWSLERIKSALRDLHNSEYHSDRLAGLNRPLFSLMLATALSLMMLAGASLLGGPQSVLLPQLALFLVISFRLLVPVSALTTFRNQLIRSGPVLEELENFLSDSAGQISADGRLDCPGLQKELLFCDVSFAYAPDQASFVLRDINLSIRAGEVCAMVGASGAGKSSLVKLISGLCRPQSGRILLDGIDLREIHCDSWRSKIAVVSQDIFLFHASVRDNLLFARPDAGQAEMEKACRLAQAHDFIMDLEDGYETVLQEQGRRLSGGQRQRIALARALLLEADLLILDEATSELDLLTEQQVHAALAELRPKPAVIIIAHRLSAIQDCRRIIVLDQGRVVEQGSHDELMALGRVYSRLVQAQLPSPGQADDPESLESS